MTDVHPSSVIDPSAEIGSDVSIGPFCTVGPNVVIGDGVTLQSHVVVDGWTTIGDECKIFPFASIGTQCQDLKYKGAKTFVQIGARTTIRESCTINSGTDEGDVTAVGSDCLLMAYCHVAHGCTVGNEVIMANVATLAGHVTVHDQAILGGLSAVHQFTKIGRLAMVGGCTKVTQDVLPFSIADGHPAELRGLNAIGMKRRQITPEVRKSIKEVFHIVSRENLSTPAALEKIAETVQSGAEVQYMIDFIRSSERGICK